MPNNLTSSPEWKALEERHAAVSGDTISDLFSAPRTRFEGFSASAGRVLFDYSKTLIDEETRRLLLKLARSRNIESWRDKMFSGAPINNSENRAVLHTALRQSTPRDLEIEGEPVATFVEETLRRIKQISARIRASNITDIVNIGIGGSDLGPHMVYEALAPFADGPRVHFISNVDGAHLSQTLGGLDPATTLFVIASKTFTTLETMTNTNTAKAWLGAEKTGEQFIAVTGNESAAQGFGISEDNILPLRDWVGGRYSLWSAIGLSNAIALGYDNFEKLLDGAHAADQHFQSTPLESNIPVLMALVGIWHRNFCGYDALAILPYAQNLHRFPRYIQQLDMESNGKSVDRDGHDVDYQTSPVVFGEPGTNGQHAFFQMLHQGSMVVPCDFIIVRRPEHDLAKHHKHLLSNALAQSEALMNGNGPAEAPYKKFDGNRPSISVVLDRLDPYNLGMLLALYEHKIFVQGAIWNLNSFDQWGVELGKKIAKNITQAIDSKENKGASTPLLDYILGHKA